MDFSKNNLIFNENSLILNEKRGGACHLFLWSRKSDFDLLFVGEKFLDSSE